MRIKRLMFTELMMFTAASLLLLGVIVIHRSREDSPSPPAASRARLGDVRTVRSAYDRWRAAHIRDDDGRRLTLALGYSKGLSARFTRARGQAMLDLVDGSLSVTVSGLSDRAAFDVWLVDNRPGPGRSVRPEPGDVLVRVGRLKPEGRTATLQASLGDKVRAGFEVDLVVVAPAGEAPGAAGLLFGSPTLFQRLYHSEARGPIAGPGEAATSAAPGSPGGTAWSAPFRALIPTPAFADETADAAALAALVTEGERLFFDETFAGNGRTCGTCHPAENNLTIDPAFIATLPKTDPLFVAEFVPALKKNFENPTLMRQFGLILENVDGFGDLNNKFVMRGVPHTLALATSLAPSPSDGTTTPPNERTGWSGDGAPGGGTLRDFATGAVTQHFTKTLSRRPGVDFRLPTDAELDAMEAFQLSLGRPEDPDLATLVFTNSEPRVVRGQQLFSGTAGCNACHRNAGASASFAPGNGNFNTGVEDLPKPGKGFPRDGGFGTTANGDGKGGFGNGTFNTPPLVEAADTAPFFHNNAVKTLEEAVAFYGSDEFVNSAPGRVPLINSREEADAVAAFLRVMNALENIRSSIALLERAKAETDLKKQRQLRNLARPDIDDAINVLAQGSLHPDAVNHLKTAKALISGSVGTAAFESAIQEEEAARARLVQP